MADDRVRIRLADGRTGSVPKSELDANLRMGATVVGPDKSFSQHAADLLQEKSLDLGTDVAGGLRGASAGVSDRMAIDAADVVGQKEPVRGALNYLRDRAPVRSAGAEAAGMILPAIMEGKGPAKAPGASPLEVSPRLPPGEMLAPEPGWSHPEPGPLPAPEPTPTEAVDWDHPEAAAPRKITMRGKSPSVDRPIAYPEPGAPKEPAPRVEQEPTKREGRPGERPGTIESPATPMDSREASDWWKNVRGGPEGAAIAERFSESRQGRDVTRAGLGDPVEPTVADRAREVDSIEESVLNRKRPTMGELFTPREPAPAANVNATNELSLKNPGVGEPPSNDVMGAPEPTKVGGVGPDVAPDVTQRYGANEPGAGGRLGADEEVTMPRDPAWGDRTKRYPAGAIHDMGGDPFEATQPGAAHPRPVQPPIDFAAMDPQARAAANDAGRGFIADSGIGKAAGAEPQQVRMPSIVDMLPTNVISEIGASVEKSLLRELGPEARGVLARMVDQAAKMGLRGAVEGAIYGPLQELDEAALGDKKVNASKLLAAVGHGSLWGGAIGAGLGAGGVLSRKVAGEVAMSLEKMKGQQAWKALLVGSNKTATRIAEGVPGGTSAIGNYLLERGLIKAGDNVERIAPRIAEALEHKGSDIGVIIDAHDAAGKLGQGMAERTFIGLSKMKNDLMHFPELNRGAIAEIDRVQRDMMSIYERNGRMTFRDMWEMRGRLDREAKWNRTPWSPHNEKSDVLKAMRGTFEGQVEAGIDRAGSLGDAYKEAKLEYRMLKTASKTVEDAIVSKVSNRTASLTDYMMGLAHIAAGHPVVGLVSGVAHHVVKDRGNATVAALLDKLATHEGVRRASAHMDRQIGRGVGAIFGRNRAEMALKDPVLRGDHEARVQAVANAIRSGDHLDAIQNAIAPIMRHAPETGGEFLEQATRVTRYLAAKLPQEPIAPSLTPQHDKIEWNDIEQANFARAVDIAHDPLVALKAIETGDITEDQVEAIREMYPPLYGEMKREIEYELAQTKPGELPYDKQLALSIFMQHPDPTLQASFIASMQKAFPPPPSGPPGSGKGVRSRKKKTSSTNLTFINDVSLDTGVNHTQ